MKISNMMMQKFLGLSLIAVVLWTHNALGQGTATYKLTFTSTWTSSTHPTNYPPGPHFSPLIGATHNSSVTFWQTGAQATDGIEVMAETGGTNRFRTEINTARSASNADVTISGSGLGAPPTSTSLNFNIKPSFPLVTVVSMLAPSPDWFVGVSGLSLLNSDNTWKSSEEVMLFVYDAGTDSGPSYTSSNADVTPHENIERIAGSPFLVSGNVKPVGTFLFELKNSKTITVQSSITVTEGGSSSLNVRLNAAPTANATVTFSDFINPDLSRNPTSLVFTTTDYNTPKTVTITAASDDDAIDEAAETITLTANGGGYSSVTRDVTVTVIDIDEIALDVSPTALNIAEGSSLSYNVRLKSEPAGTVTVAITGASNEITASPASLTFATTNWNVNQPVNVTANVDDNAIDEQITLTNTAAGGGYGSAPAVGVTVTANDNEQVELVVTPLTLNVDEGSSETYTVKLGSEPQGTVTVEVSGASGMISVDTDLNTQGLQSSLSFTTSDWDDLQTVTVRADQDDNAIDEQVTLTNTASGGGYASAASVGVTVNANDDEEARLVLAPVTLNIDEGASNSYTLTLNSEPSASVTVTVSSNSQNVTIDADSGTSGNQNTLTFTTSTWNDPQNVIVSAGHDDDGENEEVTLNHDATGGNFESVSSSLAVTIMDDDEAELLINPTSIIILEGASETYTIALATEPQGTVTVDVAGGSGVITVDTDSNTQGLQSSLTFTTSTWNTAQSITVTALEDNDESNHDITVTNTASGADYASVEADLSITVMDNDEPGLMVNPVSLTVNEGGVATYTIQLTTLPSGTVTVEITGESDGITLDSDANTNGDQSTLIFTTSNWNSPQTVTVSAGQDNDSINDVVTLTHSASGANYQSVETVAIEITVADDDLSGAAITIASTTVSVDEGSNATFDVTLAVPPTGEVEVGISDVSIPSLNRSPASLTFSSSNYNQPQTVTITASEDPDNNNESDSITLNPSGGGYDNASSLQVTITVQDDDAPQILLSDESIEIGEGATGNFNVSLATVPTSEVEVTVSEFTNPELTRTPATLTFTTLNYNQPKTISVSADHDVNMVNETETLTLTSTGGGYTGVSARLSVTTLDDDIGKPTVTLTVDSNPVTEGESASLTLTLSAPITSAVMIPMIITNDSAEQSDYEPVTIISIDANKMTGVATLMTNEDDDYDDEELTIKLGDLPDQVLPGTTTSIVLTIEDNDIEEVSVIFTQTIIESQIDLYIDDSLYVDNFKFQSSTRQDIEIGTIKIDVIDSDATDNSSPLYTEEMELIADQQYHIIFQGKDTDDISTVEVQDNNGDDSIAQDSVYVRVIHSAPDLGPITVQILDPESNNDIIQVLSDNLNYGDASSQVLLAQKQYNFAILGGSNKQDSPLEVFSADWSQSSQPKGFLILSGSGRSISEGLNMMGVWQDGGVYFPTKVTSAEDLPLNPIDFAVGNYPTPFIDQTNLWMTLPDASNVHIQIVDILGRMTYENIGFDALGGQRHLYEINTASWPSGVYFYRVVVTSHDGQTIGTGKMIRVK
ncbi:MAG: spondin domain-containing protein [Bacteroidetes bacterium]|nr:spondin domain-containing protein [Bacteroidota bacterium]